MSASVVARLEQVTKTYAGAQRPAVNALSLELKGGQILALLGPNGAGKTTSVKMLAGLILPTSGKASVMGHDMVEQRNEGVRHIGAVLEGARNLYWRLSAWENLLYFGTLRLVPRRILKRRITELLSLVGLAQQQHQEVRTYSRGMQQKLAIACALLHDPSLLLLDEPTLGLDVEAAKQLETTILRLARDEGRSILLTTHVMALAERLSDQIVVMHRGREIASGSTQELLRAHDVHRDIIQVRARGRLSGHMTDVLRHQFDDVQVTPDTDHTLITWPSASQSKLMQLLNFLNAENVLIEDAGRRRATLEEVFLQLTGSDGAQ